MKTQHVEVREELCSYDITMLLTSVPHGQGAFECIRRKLEANNTMQELMSISLAEIGTLLDFWLICMYFYRHIHRTSMWTHVSIIMCDTQMGELDELTIAISLNLLFGGSAMWTIHTAS